MCCKSVFKQFHVSNVGWILCVNLAFCCVDDNGRAVDFHQEKIAEAVEKAFRASGAMQPRGVADGIAERVVEKIESGAIEGTPTVEGVQDLVEETLIEEGFPSLGFSTRIL